MADFHGRLHLEFLIRLLIGPIFQDAILDLENNRVYCSQNNSPLSFSAPDWLLPLWARYSSYVNLKQNDNSAYANVEDSTAEWLFYLLAFQSRCFCLVYSYRVIPSLGPILNMFISRVSAPTSSKRYDHWYAAESWRGPIQTTLPSQTRARLPTQKQYKLHSYVLKLIFFSSFFPTILSSFWKSNVWISLCSGAEQLQTTGKDRFQYWIIKC